MSALSSKPCPTPLCSDAWLFSITPKYCPISTSGFDLARAPNMRELPTGEPHCPCAALANRSNALRAIIAARPPSVRRFAGRPSLASIHFGAARCLSWLERVCCAYRSVFVPEWPCGSTCVAAPRAGQSSRRHRRSRFRGERCRGDPKGPATLSPWTRWLPRAHSVAYTG